MQESYIVVEFPDGQFDWFPACCGEEEYEAEQHGGKLVAICGTTEAAIRSARACNKRL